MKHLLFLLFFVCSLAQAAFTDIKFGRYQVADTQWNVNACMNTATCQIYSKNPGVAYKIPWTSGQLSWATGDYIKFEASGNASYPYTARQYNSNGTLKATLGMGKVLNAGSDYFFFMGSDNNTGQLFSGTVGMSGSAGVSWTGTLNPTTTQVNTITSTYSSEPLASGTTYTATPALCCGGSSAAFGAEASNVAKVMAFVNRTTADTKVSIEQIGSSNTILVNQEGTVNNYAKYYSTGSNNNISIRQQANTAGQTNYVDLTVTGNSNTVDIRQQTTNETNTFGKGVFASIADNNNTLTILQKNGGAHYADVALSGGNKNVDITQQGNGNHMAKVGLTGMPTDLSLTQSGNTQQSYSINFNCATSGGCAKITVTQGQ
jgi:hypothetical protein